MHTSSISSDETGCGVSRGSSPPVIWHRVPPPVVWLCSLRLYISADVNTKFKIINEMWFKDRRNKSGCFRIERSKVLRSGDAGSNPTSVVLGVAWWQRGKCSCFTAVRVWFLCFPVSIFPPGPCRVPPGAPVPPPHQKHVCGGGSGWTLHLIIVILLSNNKIKAFLYLYKVFHSLLFMLSVDPVWSPLHHPAESIL